MIKPCFADKSFLACFTAFLACSACMNCVAQSGGEPAASVIPERMTGKSVDGRQPVPSAVAQQAAAKKLREVFSNDFVDARTAVKKRELAKTLADQAESTIDPSERWAMLSEALRLAVDAGDVSASLALLERIPREFAVASENEGRLDTLTKLATKASAEDTETLGKELLSLARTMAEGRAPTPAMKAVTTVMAVARKSKNADLATAAAKLHAFIKEQQRDERSEEAMLAKLEQSPRDPDVCLEVGRFYCFKLDNWAKGLPLLATGSHPALAQVAKSELASGGEPVKLIPLADQWWELSKTEGPAVKVGIQIHAADLYRLGLSSLSGLEKVRVEKRIAAAAAGGRQSGRSVVTRIPGLVLWLDASDISSLEPPVQRGQGESRIARWRDLSGNGHDATQTDPKKQPSWATDAFDGNAGLVFSGLQTLEVRMPCGSTGTMFATLWPKSRGNMRVLGCYRGENEYVGMCLRSDGSVWAEALTPGNAAARVRTPQPIYTAKGRVLLTQSWGGTLSLIANGMGSSGSYSPSTTLFPGPWGVGGASLTLAVEYYQGSIGEVLVFDREITKEEIETVSTGLRAKWNCR